MTNLKKMHIFFLLLFVIGFTLSVEAKTVCIFDEQNV